MRSHGSAARGILERREMFYAGLAGKLLVGLVAAAVWASVAVAQTLPAAGESTEHDGVTHHAITVGGRTIGYTATAGNLLLRGDDSKPSARVFYVSYVADGQQNTGRPVSFFLDGGPGAATAFLNLGAAGPTVLKFPESDPFDGAKARLAPNASTWLPFTDMVFIDAVGTGYSVPTSEEVAPQTFWGVQKDGDVLADVVRLWIGRNHREADPKYLVGESYGGLRSIKTAYALQVRDNIPLAGIVMISPVIEMKFVADFDDPMFDAMMLPSLAAVADERAHKFSIEHVNAVADYAFGDYLKTLAGPPPNGEGGSEFYGKIAEITGLPVDIVAKERALIDPWAHDIRSRDGRLYSVYDGTRSDVDPFPEGVENDDSLEPTQYGYVRAFGNAFEGYASSALGYHTDDPYVLRNSHVNQVWDYRDGYTRISPGMPDFRRLMSIEPSLRVFIATGYFDLAIPFSMTNWLVSHMPIGRERINIKTYKGGHILYLRPDSRAALTQDVGKFYSAAQ